MGMRVREGMGMVIKMRDGEGKEMGVGFGVCSIFWVGFLV